MHMLGLRTQEYVHSRDKYIPRRGKCIVGARAQWELAHSGSLPEAQHWAAAPPESELTLSPSTMCQQ